MKKVNETLNLNKKTIAQLNNNEMNHIKGGRNCSRRWSRNHPQQCGAITGPRWD